MVREKKAIILSTNEELKIRLINLLDKVGITYFLKENKFDVILNLFNPNIHLVFVDIDPDDEERFELLRIMKKIRPRLYIFVIINDLSVDICDDYLSAGAEYCLINTNVDIEKTLFAEKLDEFEI